MIISHKYKFIFIKCGKVAGSSLEMALRPHLGEDDIVTPVAEDTKRGLSSNDFKSTDGSLLYGPKNYRNSIDYDRRLSQAGARGVFYEHAWAYEIKGQVSSKIWDSYYKFAIERDPRDKSLSVYYHTKNGLAWPIRKTITNLSQICLPLKSFLPPPHQSIAKVCSLSRWLKEDRKHAFAMNWNRYTVNDEVIVDKVYSYSMIHQVIADLEGIIGAKLNLPRLKTNFREARKLSLKESNLLEKLMNNEIYQKEYNLINNVG